MKRVLFVDDQPDLIQYFTDGIKAAGFSVDVIPDIVSAIDYLKSPPSDLVAIVLDIMMPPGPFSDEDHRAGTRSGVFLYEKLCDMQYVQTASGRPLPLAVLTQVSDPATLKILEDLQSRNRPNERFQLWSKVGLEVDDFVTGFSEWLEVIETFWKEP